jgi:small subunit ribosomal protein S17
MAQRPLRKTRIGVVVSNKMDKKYFKKTTRLMAHDEKRECQVGDKVKIMETRPLSAKKRWRLVEIVEKAK